MPAHEPGTAVAEHALTYGHLCDALVRRTTGEPLANRFSVLAREREWDLHLAVDRADLERVADVVTSSPVRTARPPRRSAISHQILARLIMCRAM